MDARPPPERRPKRRLRIFTGVALILVCLGSAAVVLFSWPMRLGPAILLIMLTAASAATFAAYFVPNKLSERTKRAGTVGVGAVGLIATLVAVPALQDPDGTSTADQGTPTLAQEPAPTLASGTAASSPPSPSSTADPLTAVLEVGLNCEAFALPVTWLKALPQHSYPDAKWIYERGGSTTDPDMSLTVQGEDADAVVLLGLRVVELERSPVPPNLADLGCDSAGGGLESRYFDVILSSPPRVVPRPGRDDEDNVTEPAVKFPFRVSSSDPEFFEIFVSGPPCLCKWRLALDWTSKGRKGTTLIDRGFDKIITDVWDEDQAGPTRPAYALIENKWDPPLPK